MYCMIRLKYNHSTTCKSFFAKPLQNTRNTPWRWWFIPCAARSASIPHTTIRMSCQPAVVTVSFQTARARHRSPYPAGSTTAAKHTKIANTDIDFLCVYVSSPLPPPPSPTQQWRKEATRRRIKKHSILLPSIAPNPPPPPFALTQTHSHSHTSIAIHNNIVHNTHTQRAKRTPSRLRLFPHFTSFRFISDPGHFRHQTVPLLPLEDVVVHMRPIFLALSFL